MSQQGTIVLTQAEFDSLPEYSCSLPTGTAIGKKWKRNIHAFDPALPRSKNGQDDWYLCEYVPHADPAKIGITYKHIVAILKLPKRMNLSEQEQAELDGYYENHIGTNMELEYMPTPKANVMAALNECATHYRQLLAEKDKEIANKEKEILSAVGTIREMDALVQKRDKEIADLKELLTNIDKSLYLGDGLKDEEILNWYMEVVKTIKDEIRQQIV